MNIFFTYSLLQYKHSPVLGEAINVGILFYFPKENHFEFTRGDGYRAKAIYPDFDNSLFNGYIKTITNKIKNQVTLFNEQVDKSDFARYIHQNILAEDAAGLVFTQPVQVNYTNGEIHQVVNEYAKLLLPGIITEKPSVVIKHNENFILKTFQGYLIRNNTALDKKFKKNQIIHTPHFNIKFELAWEQKSINYIKPLSFDVNDENSILNKAAILFSHLTDLKEYAKLHNTRFDILISKPQDKQFIKEYENALDLIDSVKVPKQLLTQEKWEDYTAETAALLS